MTHEELLLRLDELDMWISLGQVHKDDIYAMAATIRAVVGLHHPDDDNFCNAETVIFVPHTPDETGYCDDCKEVVDDSDDIPLYVPYPCPTIQAIEKELK